MRLQRFLMGPTLSRLGAGLPPRLKVPLSELRLRIASANIERRAAPPLPEALRRELSTRFEPDTAYVEQLLGRDLSAWRHHPPPAGAARRTALGAAPRSAAAVRVR